MLNITFLDCTKVKLWDLTVCIVVNGEKFNLGPTMPNIELVQVILYFHILQCI